MQYRGIFLNDEEELNAWAKLHTTDGTIGPATYRSVFELILRLKGNYIWPAMHVNAFNADPENGRLADEMGIVVGTSHCDMLLRSNQHEFDPWVEKKGYTGLLYDYSLEENRPKLQEYWRESVEQNAAYEVSFTLGMRGIHDSGFRTRSIDENAALSEEQKLEARVRLLEKVITDQREIIRSVLHHERPDEALQVFIPYKEVLPLYDAGLVLPEDITVMWTNDNFGHIRRYPSKQEQMRKGGHALYFHSSYWAPAPLSYLFINSIPLAQTGCELRKAYENGIRKIWVDNVGTLKPLEQDMEYFLAFGWDVARPEALVHHIHEYLVRWFNEQFSGNFGEECARIYEAYAQITNVCKVEHLYRDAFSQTAYGDEAGRRVNRLRELYSRVCRVHDALPADERDAFFELLGMRVSASYFINAAFYYADRSRLSYRQGKMQCADEYLHLSRRMMGCKRQMLYFYNRRMAGGKWKGILTPEAFPPPASCTYTDAKPALSIGETAMGIILWNEEEESPSPRLTFDEKGVQTKWLEIFNRGCGSFSFTIENGCPFLDVSELQGEVQTEKRILLTLRGTPQEGSLIVRSDRGEEIRIAVSAAPDAFYSFSASEMRPEPADGFRAVEYLDRMQGACMEAAKSGAGLVIPFFQPCAGDCTVEVTRYLTLGRITLYFGDTPIRRSHLGPEPFGSNLDERIPSVDETSLRADTLRRFGIAWEDVPPLKLTYAGHGYWNIDRLYLPNEEREQAFAPPRYVFERVGKKQILPLFPDGIFIEEEGKLCLEAEYALAESPSAWRTPDGNGRVWEHLSAETNGGTGLSMMVEEPDLYWEKDGPALHFRGLFTGGKYYVWLLMRFDDPSNDACMVGIDGTMQPRAEQYGRGGFFTYSSQFLWVWTLLSEVEIAAGEHVFSLAAVKSGLRIDRIYLTKGRELPPDDAHFLPSPRHAK